MARGSRGALGRWGAGALGRDGCADGGLRTLLVLANALNLVFPGGLLQEYLDLPWPFR